MPLPSTHLSLLAALKEGEQREEAWAVFVATYRGTICGWCRHRGISAASADDMTQEVLLKLFDKLPQGKYDASRAKFRTWLKAVVNNAVTDYLRKEENRRGVGGVGGSSFQEQMANLASQEAVEELSGQIDRRTAAVEAAALERVRGKVKKEDTTWKAVYQTLVEQRPYADVAAELGLTKWAVYKAVKRVTKMLKAELRNVAPANDPSDLSGRIDTAEVSK